MRVRRVSTHSASTLSDRPRHAPIRAGMRGLRHKPRHKFPARRGPGSRGGVGSSYPFLRLLDTRTSFVFQFFWSRHVDLRSKPVRRGWATLTSRTTSSVFEGVSKPVPAGKVNEVLA